MEHDSLDRRAGRMDTGLTNKGYGRKSTDHPSANTDLALTDDLLLMSAVVL